MGILQRDQIIAQGLRQAAREDLDEGDAPATIDFLVWLREMAAAWPWPRLYRDATAVALAANAATLDFGAGAAITPKVARILDPVYIYNSTYTVRGTVRVATLTGTSDVWDETVNDPARNVGQPQTVKVKPFAFTTTDTPGKWTLAFSPIPDRAYLLKVQYILLPENPGSTDIPWYPSDRTMIQSVKTMALGYGQKAPNYQEELALLDAMITRDKAEYGWQTGTNQGVQLDSRYFKTPIRRQWPADN